MYLHRTQANTGKYSWQIICVLVLCQGIVCLSSKAPQKTAQRKVAGPFAISPLQFLITPQQFPITPQQFPITPRLHLHFLIFSDLITKNYTYTYTFQFF